MDAFLAQRFKDRTDWGERFDALVERIQRRVPAAVRLRRSRPISPRRGGRCARRIARRARRSVRAVVDTNVWISAVLNPTDRPGSVRRALVDRQFTLVTSEYLLAKIREVLARPTAFSTGSERSPCFLCALSGRSPPQVRVQSVGDRVLTSESRSPLNEIRESDRGLIAVLVIFGLGLDKTDRSG